MSRLRTKYYSSFTMTGLFLVCVLLIGLPASAGSLVSQSFSGIAIKGYDPVAYFTENKAIKGSDEFTHRWLGATWNFASAEHMEMFKADPINYLPQYGGYCAASMKDSATYEADPEAWRIVDGMLYLNYSTRLMTKWAKDIPGNISVANEKWVLVKSGLTQ
jgi:YHS domain-containing protein